MTLNYYTQVERITLQGLFKKNHELQDWHRTIELEELLVNLSSLYEIFLEANIFVMWANNNIKRGIYKPLKSYTEVVAS